jgi:hypothetical protein
MKHVLAILGGIAVAMVIAAIGAGIAAYQMATLGRSSKAYLETNLPSIVSTWSTDALLARAMPDLQDHAAEVRKTFQQLATLGCPQHIEVPDGDTPVLIPTSDGKRKGAVYKLSMKCQRGEVRIMLWLIKVDDDWKFEKFVVKLSAGKHGGKGFGDE